MKRLCFFCTLSLIVAFLNANPIPSPPVIFLVSELYFDENDNWIMEIKSDRYYYCDITLIDSISITTSGGRSLIKLHPRQYYDYNMPEVIVLDNDSLSSPLPIRREGDKIEITAYSEYREVAPSQLIFGDFAGSNCRSPQNGESITYIDFRYNPNEGYSAVHSINKTPTPGTIPDNLAGTTCKLRMHILYPSSKPVFQETIFIEEEEDITFDEMDRQEDGSYMGIFRACKYDFNRVYLNKDTTWIMKDTYTIQPEPGDSLVLPDILLSKYIYTRIDQIETQATILNIYPNPVTGKTFQYKSMLPVRSSDSFLEIMNSEGKTIEKHPLSETNGTINLNPDTPPGIYFTSLLINNKRYKSSRIIVQ